MIQSFNVLVFLIGETPHDLLPRLYLSELPGRIPGELRTGSGRGTRPIIIFP